MGIVVHLKFWSPLPQQSYSKDKSENIFLLVLLLAHVAWAE